MKWYHLPILVSIGLALLAVQERVLFGSADTFIVLGAIPALIYASTKTLIFVFRNRL